MKLLNKLIGLPLLLFGLFVFLSAETCNFTTTPIKVSNVTCIGSAFVNNNNGQLDTLKSNRLIFRDGGVGVIVIRDPLSPGEEDIYAGYDQIYMQSCSAFELVNVSDKMVCAMENGKVVHGTCKDLEKIDEIIVTIHRTDVMISIPPREAAL